MDLQSLQVAGKHSSFSIIEGCQVFRTRFAENTGSEIDKVATHVHGTNGGIAIEEKFAYSQMRWEMTYTDSWANRLVDSFPGN